MWLKDVVIRQFRNIADAALSLSPGVTLLIGENGQGKTNALEALAILASQRYPAGLADAEVLMWDHTWFDLRATWQDGTAAHLTSRYAVSREGKIRRVKEGPTYPYVAFAPHDLKLAQSGPHHRRAYLDAVASTLYPRYAKALVLYERAVAQKNRGLKEKWPSATIDTFNQLIAEHGSLLWRLRRDTLSRLLPEIYRVHAHLTGAANLRIWLKPGGVEGDVPMDSASVLAQIARRRADETIRLVSLVGPHRDDLIMEIHDHLASTFASQGQQRTLVLALKLATYNLYRTAFDTSPLVLLDDVFSELDSDRRAHLLELVTQDGAQTVITDTEWRDYAALDPKVFHVADGGFRLASAFG